MANKLPKLTPQEIKDWVSSVEVFHPVSIITSLPEDATLAQIKEAFLVERDTLIGIGEELKERAKWNAWNSYEELTCNDED